MSPSTQHEYSNNDPDKQWRAERAEELLGHSHIPDRHKPLIGKEDSPPEWLAKMEMLRSATATPGSMFCLIGPRGTGKTQLAVTLIRFACKRMYHSYYCKSMDFFLELKNSYRPNSRLSELGVFNKYHKPDFLVIDEIQVRSESAWENQAFTHLIDQRYDAMKTTILIGNLKAENLAASLGESIYSRLTETGGVVVCDWQSFRQGNG
jgi:DNA replication protein DnaC